ncbi:mycothiol acetyltransferase [Aeromicrobium flavum]|uniref:Mycothiol acetyltransferase n=1 Tax=Aeromicrobium flavum TaxID=416568 RepID=A0A512HT00_9ACTN|nr:mycothiol synthase [Aeromicrobium flavum]GEO88567.1 mycothiol acetyltransferase [Aeromicrobium flavum]
MSLFDLAEAALEADGVAPFNEATTLAVRDGDPLRLERYDEVVGAVAVGDAPVEFVVHPRYRRQGRGRALVDDLVSRGETRFWAHGDLPGARALAAAAGLHPARTLLVLATTDRSVPEVPTPDGAVLRSFHEDDADAVVAVNARAFASHPEQGAMDRADFDRRRSQDWFDPAGLFVAERDGDVVGFHWTKVEDGVGEVYVVGVDPAAHGGGLGKALTAVGLRHLWDRGVSEIDLYVEGDNDPALAVYRGLGFAEKARDVLYAAD